MQRSDFRFADRLRVRWAEVDMQKVVFNGHYLTYVDTAFGAYWRALALPYEATLQALEGDLFVRRAALEYAAPARYDEVLDVGIRFEGAGTSSLRFAAGVFRGRELLVGGELVYVWTGGAGRRPCPAPAALLDALRAHEAGEDMLRLEAGGWDALGAEAHALRTAVFVEELGVPAALEQDAEDAAALHVVARNRLGLAVGTGRLIAGAPARIGRLAVRRDLRGAGVGRRLLDALADAAAARGETALALFAEASAVPFYRRAGFVVHGAPFEEAGIAHQEMRRGG